MLNFNKIIEIFVSLQIIIISTFFPVFITIPFTNKINGTFDIPITWQVPSIIIITLIFNGETVIKAFSLYLIIGLFFIPVFHEGGSLGYLLTPNFGYLLGTYPLINIIDNLNKNHQKINYYDLLKYGSLGICSMHFTGMMFSSIQMIYFKQSDILFYSIAKYSLGKIGFHFLMLTPITLLLKLININKYKNNV